MVHWLAGEDAVACKRGLNESQCHAETRTREIQTKSSGGSSTLSVASEALCALGMEELETFPA